ncbi:MAG: low molecular weight protein-tyrosine-phosphatase [Balneolaceae bacterium]
MNLNRQSISKENPYKLCFVCLGNICRSPTAEGVFQHKVNENNLDPYFIIDSAGTSAYHIGEPANTHSQMTARKHGISLESRARRFDYSNLNEFDLILAMDSENYRNLNQLDRKNQYTERIKMIRDFDPEPGDGEVPDPYFGGQDGFENVFQIIDRSCENLLEELASLIKHEPA